MTKPIKLKRLVNTGSAARYIIIGVSLITAGISLEAQVTDCRSRLEIYIGKQIFPSEQIADYEQCLVTIENYYYGEQRKLDSHKQVMKERKKDSTNNAASLKKSLQGKDSVAVLSSKSKVDSVNRLLKKLRVDSASIQRELLGFKNILNQSFAKLVQYYTQIESPKVGEWESKKRSFIAKAG